MKLPILLYLLVVSTSSYVYGPRDGGGLHIATIPRDVLSVEEVPKFINKLQMDIRHNYCSSISNFFTKNFEMSQCEEKIGDKNTILPILCKNNNKNADIKVDDIFENSGVRNELTLHLTVSGVTGEPIRVQMIIQKGKNLFKSIKIKSIALVCESF